jgi:hypothetical protein
MARNRKDIDATLSEQSLEEQRHERIAERAYERYVTRGRSDGRDWDDWLAAERELTEDRPLRDD